GIVSPRRLGPSLGSRLRGSTRIACENGARRRRPLLFAKTQLRDEIRVALTILVTEIVEQRPTLVDHHQQPAARMIVLLVVLEMLGQVADALGEDRDLNFGGTRIAFGAGMILDERFLALLRNRHRFPFESEVETTD